MNQGNGKLLFLTAYCHLALEHTRLEPELALWGIACNLVLLARRERGNKYLCQLDLVSLFQLIIVRKVP